MNTIHKRRERKPRLTLERATLVALVLHLLAGAVVTVWPGLLRPAELMAAPEQPPIEFNFVDTPESEPPAEPPDTNVLSDVDRQAADAAEPTDSPDPFSEGNTVERLVRPALPPAEASEAAPASEPQPEQQATEPQPEASEPEESAEEPTEEVADVGAEAVEAAEEEIVEAAEATQPTTPLPPRPRSLRRSLSRPESFVDPQMYDNPDGGAGGDRPLAQFDTRGYDLGAYLNQVLGRIERNWRANMPPLLRTGVGGAAFVALSIRRQRNEAGDEIAVIVAEQTWTSGQPAYDSAAQYALELSNPLPPIPEFYPHEAITGRLGFIYNLDPREVVFPEDR